MIKKMKIVMCVVFVVIFNVYTFAAVVSDNDGSAFITKAEFDSLKNSFQSQIDQFNTSIDSKIDGAISSYLAGIKVGKTTRYTEDMGVLSTPLKIYMNLNDKSSTKIRSDWRPTQKWRCMFGYYSGYATNWITAYNNTYQPKQWYNLEYDDVKGAWEVTGGYKKIETTCNYLVWALSDTGLGSESTSMSTAHASHGYAVCANGSLSSSWSPSKYNTANYKYNTIQIGDWSWQSDNTQAPTVNGITGVNAYSTAGAVMKIQKSSATQGILNNSLWYSGWFGILGSSQATIKETNKIDVVPSTNDDWVHVLYDGAIKYSVSDEYIGYGAVGTQSASMFPLTGQMRTFSRNVGMSDRGPYALAVSPFSIINEGYNATTTTINFQNWWNTSLVKSTHVGQVFKNKGINNEDLWIGMGEGLYLLTPKDDGKAEITVNVTYTGDAPYILINNARPIYENGILSDMEAAGFKKVTGGSATIISTNDYLRYLDSGKDTKIKVEEIEKGKPICAKILWDPSSTDYVTLNSPMIIDYTTDS